MYLVKTYSCTWSRGFHAHREHRLSCRRERISWSFMERDARKHLSSPKKRSKHIPPFRRCPRSQPRGAASGDTPPCPHRAPPTAGRSAPAGGWNMSGGHRAAHTQGILAARLNGQLCTGRRLISAGFVPGNARIISQWSSVDVDGPLRSKIDQMLIERPLSSEFGTYKTVMTRIWAWLSAEVLETF